MLYNDVMVKGVLFGMMFVYEIVYLVYVVMEGVVFVMVDGYVVL